MKSQNETTNDLLSASDRLLLCEHLLYESKRIDRLEKAGAFFQEDLQKAKKHFPHLLVKLAKHYFNKPPSKIAEKSEISIIQQDLISKATEIISDKEETNFADVPSIRTLICNELCEAVKRETTLEGSDNSDIQKEELNLLKKDISTTLQGLIEVFFNKKFPDIIYEGLLLVLKNQSESLNNCHGNNESLIKDPYPQEVNSIQVNINSEHSNLGERIALENDPLPITGNNVELTSNAIIPNIPIQQEVPQSPINRKPQELSSQLPHHKDDTPSILQNVQEKPKGEQKKDKGDTLEDNNVAQLNKMVCETTSDTQALMENDTSEVDAYFIKSYSTEESNIQPLSNHTTQISPLQNNLQAALNLKVNITPNDNISNQEIIPGTNLPYPEYDKPNATFPVSNGKNVSNCFFPTPPELKGSSEEGAKEKPTLETVLNLFDQKPFSDKSYKTVEGFINNSEIINQADEALVATRKFLSSRLGEEKYNKQLVNMKNLYEIALTDKDYMRALFFSLNPPDSNNSAEIHTKKPNKKDNQNRRPNLQKIQASVPERNAGEYFAKEEPNTEKKIKSEKAENSTPVAATEKTSMQLKP